MNNENKSVAPDSKKVNMDKLLSIIANLSEEELYILLLNGNTIMMEKNILCGKE